MNYYNYIDILITKFTDNNPMFIRWLCAILIIYIQMLTWFAFPLTVGYKRKDIVLGGWLNKLINYTR